MYYQQIRLILRLQMPVIPPVPVPDAEQKYKRMNVPFEPGPKMIKEMLMKIHWSTAIVKYVV